MPSPLIGITTSRITPPQGAPLAQLSDAYTQSVLNAGGLPVLIPAGIDLPRLRDLCSHLQGILFTGGADVDPQRFGGATHPRVYGIDPARDDLEISLVNLAVQARLPFMGICRGIQVINVALGGTLYTDIADQLPTAAKHDSYPDWPRDYLAHPVTVLPGSRLSALLGCPQVQTNSLHHQGVAHLAPGLKAVAFTPDGLVEGVELAEHPFGIGVQWHPECLPDHAAMRALFKGLVDAAGQTERE